MTVDKVIKESVGLSGVSQREVRLLSILKKRLSLVQRFVSTIKQGKKFVVKVWVSRFYFKRKLSSKSRENLFV